MAPANTPPKGRYGPYVYAARNKIGWSQLKLAEHFGRSKANVSGWERNAHNPNVAQLQELSRLSGLPIPGMESHAIQQDRAGYIATDSSEIQRLITAFGWLTDEQQKAALADLESKAETNKAISRELGPRWEFKPDNHVAKHIEPDVHTHPMTRKKKTGSPSRNTGDVLGDFRQDD